MISTVLFSGTLTSLILFSLPFFYEQTSSQQLVSFSILFICLLLFGFLFNKVLVKQYQVIIKSWKNVIFVVLLTIIIASATAVSSIHFWSRPELHQVEICFDAEIDTKQLEIHKLEEPKTNRLFSPKRFGFKHYPIIINSGECIEGQITTLYWSYPLRYILKIMNVVVQKNPPNGRLFISVNENPAVVYFDKQSEDFIGNEIFFTEGFDQGKVLDFARNKYIYLGFKSIVLGLSSLYLALILFSLTELILNYQPENLDTENARK